MENPKGFVSVEEIYSRAIDGLAELAQAYKHTALLRYSKGKTDEHEFYMAKVYETLEKVAYVKSELRKIKGGK